MGPAKPQHGDLLIRRGWRVAKTHRHYGKYYRVLVGTDIVTRVPRLKWSKGLDRVPVGAIHSFAEGQYVTPGGVSASLI